MKFFGVENVREFCECVLRCSGDVYEIGADGSERSLKSMAEYLMDSGLAEQMSGIGEIRLRFQNSRDMDILLRYAMRMGREKICA